MMDMNKPHISLTKDGSLWVCSTGEIPGGMVVGYGNTPKEAYVSWTYKIEVFRDVSIDVPKGHWYAPCLEGSEWRFT